MSDTIRGQKTFGLSRFRRSFASGDAAGSPGVAKNMPSTREELGEFIRKAFGISVPDVRMCGHHDTPMDYLWASFRDQADLLVWSNRGGGKTMLAAVATLLDAMFRAPVSVRVLGGSFGQSDRLAEYIREVLCKHPELLDGPMTRHRVALANGSVIKMLAQSQRSVRGQHVQKVRCDEVDLFDAEVWRAVQFTTMSSASARGSIEVLSTLHRPGGLMDRLVKSAAQWRELCNGDEGGEDTDRRTATRSGGYRLVKWCLWEVIEECPPGRSCNVCPLEEDCNGLARRGRGFFRIDDAIAIKSRSSRGSWEAEMLCKGAQREYLVLGEFDTSRHVRQFPWQRDWPTYRAIDFGYRNPFVCLWIQISPGGEVHVTDEYVQTAVPLARHAVEILDRTDGVVGKILATYVDPAGRQRESITGAACTELLAASGIPCTWRGSGIVEGLELIRSALAPATGLPKLVIHPRCEKLIEALSTYHYPSPGAAGDADRPAKDGPDHVIDALRYFFINRMRPVMGTERRGY